MTRNTRASTPSGVTERAAKPSRCSSIREKASKLSRRPRTSLANCTTTSAKSAPRYLYQSMRKTSRNTRDRRIMPEKVSYYAMLLGDRTIENPSGLARRRLSDGGGVRDEALGRDFTWVHNPGLAGW